MRHVLAGGFMSLMGCIWTAVLLRIADNYAINGWATPPGKLGTQLLESGLMPWVIVALIWTGLGVILMGIGLFKKRP